MRSATTISVGALIADPDTFAPVSGLRCRDCGLNARRADPDVAWLIFHSAAYCPACASENGYPMPRASECHGSEG